MEPYSVAFGDWFLFTLNHSLESHPNWRLYQTSSLFITEQYSPVWMYHRLFNHTHVEEHWGCFQVLIVTNKAAMNIYLQVFV